MISGMKGAVCVTESPGVITHSPKSHLLRPIFEMSVTAAEVPALNTTEEAFPSSTCTRRRFLNLKGLIQSCLIETSVWKCKIPEVFYPRFQGVQLKVGEKN